MGPLRIVRQSGTAGNPHEQRPGTEASADIIALALLQRHAIATSWWPEACKIAGIEAATGHAGKRASATSNVARALLTSFLAARSGVLCAKLLWMGHAEVQITATGSNDAIGQRPLIHI
jgi:hypothetical protein